MENIESKLLQKNWLTPQEFQQAKQEEKETNKSLYSCLIKLGIKKEEDIYRFFSETSTIPFVDIDDYHLEEKVVKLLPETFCRENLVFPLFKRENLLYVAMAKPLNTDIVNLIEIKTGCETFPLLSTPSGIIKAIDNFFGPDDKLFNPEGIVDINLDTSFIPRWRNSSRLPFATRIELSVEDRDIKLKRAFCAKTKDIAEDASSLGIEANIFLPKGTAVKINFPELNISDIKASVIYCRPQKGLNLMGIQINEISPQAKTTIINRIKELE